MLKVRFFTKQEVFTPWMNLPSEYDALNMLISFYERGMEWEIDYSRVETYQEWALWFTADVQMRAVRANTAGRSLRLQGVSYPTWESLMRDLHKGYQQGIKYIMVDSDAGLDVTLVPSREM